MIHKIIRHCLEKDDTDSEEIDIGNQIKRKKKMRVTPGEIFRYSMVILLIFFAFLFITSLFFPELVGEPNLDKIKELIDIFLDVIGHESTHEIEPPVFDVYPD